MRTAIFITVTVLLAAASSHAEPFRFVQDEEAGTITIVEGQTPVLTYRYGPQLKEGVAEKYRRACYVHPVYALSGEPITNDFPGDHPHHRGLSWTWPWVKTRGRKVQTWHPSPLKQTFDRWLARKAGDESATLRLRNRWRLDGETTVARETVMIEAFAARETGRAIDLTITIEAVGGPLTLRGKQRKQKGYGGLMVRGASSLKGATLTANTGKLEGDSVGNEYKWVDLSSDQRGVAVFVHPEHVDAPLTWLVRSSYGGILNAEWPGLKPATIEPGHGVRLRYRLYVHKGDAKAGGVAEAYRRYVQRVK